jgi:hypothetical protein
MPVWCALIGAAILALFGLAQDEVFQQSREAWRLVANHLYVFYITMMACAFIAAALIDEGKQRGSKALIAVGNWVNSLGAVCMVAFFVLATIVYPSTLMLVLAFILSVMSCALGLFLFRHSLRRNFHRLGTRLFDADSRSFRGDSIFAVRTPIREILSDFEEEKSSRNMTRFGVALLFTAVMVGIVAYLFRRATFWPIRRILTR